MTPTIRMLAALATMLAMAGWASAQSPCPECDADGEPGTNSSYSSVDLGVIDEDDLETVADTDASVSDSDSHTFFAWISICLSAFVDNIVGLVDVDPPVDADATADVYVSENGIDLDATVVSDGETVLDFDDSEVGDLDGATWEGMTDVKETLGIEGNLGGGVGDLVPDNVDIDLCLDVDLATALPCP